VDALAYLVRIITGIVVVIEMYPNYCANCGKVLPKEISAYNLDNYYSDFYECGIGFDIECPSCLAAFTLVPNGEDDMQVAIGIHKKFFPYNEMPT